MSEPPENRTDDLGATSLDDEDQLQPEDTLEQEDVDDVLDRGYSPPEKLHGSIAHGVTVEEQHHEETIEERIRQEVPDPDTAYGAPENESGLEGAGRGRRPRQHRRPGRLDRRPRGGRRPGRATRRAGRGRRSATTEKDLVGEDVGIDGAAASAEEAAVHVVDEEDGEG